MSHTDQVLEILQQRADKRGRVDMTTHEIASRLGCSNQQVLSSLMSLRKRGRVTYREKRVGSVLEMNLIRVKEIVHRDTPLHTVTRPHRTMVHPVGEDALDWRRKPAIAPGGPVTTTGAQHPPVPPSRGPLTERVYEYLKRWPTDSEGWVEITNKTIAEHLGMTPDEAATAMHALTRRQHDGVEVLKATDGLRSPVIGVRLMDEKRKMNGAAQVASEVAAATVARAVPTAVVPRLPATAKRPATPLLDEYRQARLLAGRSRYLVFEPDPLIEEALALIEALEK